MEHEVVEAELVLPTHFKFKKIQMYEKYPKGQTRVRWKHLKQIIPSENYQSYPPDVPNYVNIESPPSMHPRKRICDITGYEAPYSDPRTKVVVMHEKYTSQETLYLMQAPYSDPRTKLRCANAEVFKVIRSLPNDYVQRYLALRNAAVCPEVAQDDCKLYIEAYLASECLLDSPTNIYSPNSILLVEGCFELHM